MNYKYLILFAAATYISSQQVSCQTLSVIHPDSYSEVSSFFQKNKQHIYSIDKRIRDCNSIFSGNYRSWTYVIAKPVLFKTLDKKQQAYFDTAKAIMISLLQNVAEEITAIYFPVHKGSYLVDDAIIDMKTDLLTNAYSKNDNISVLYHIDAIQNFTNSDRFTLCEYLGLYNSVASLPLGNIIFARKGLIVSDALPELIKFFNNFHASLKAKGIVNGMCFAVHFSSVYGDYGGIFRVINGNINGELKKLTPSLDLPTMLLSDNFFLDIPTNEIYLATNKKYSSEALASGLARKGILLKSMIEYSPPAKTYALTIIGPRGAKSSYANISFLEVGNILAQRNIKCGVSEACVSADQIMGITFSCKAGDDALSVTISTDATLEFNLKTNGKSSNLSFDQDGRLKITSSFEN